VFYLLQLTYSLNERHVEREERERESEVRMMKDDRQTDRLIDRKIDRWIDG
jgi:hypothetical protein